MKINENHPKIVPVGTAMQHAVSETQGRNIDAPLVASSMVACGIARKRLPHFDVLSLGGRSGAALLT